MFVDPSQVLEAVGVQCVDQHQAQTGARTRRGKMFKQCKLHRGAEKAFDAMHARRDDQRRRIGRAELRYVDV